jgi:hypothetical protein
VQAWLNLMSGYFLFYCQEELFLDEVKETILEDDAAKERLANGDEGEDVEFNDDMSGNEENGCKSEDDAERTEKQRDLPIKQVRM